MKKLKAQNLEWLKIAQNQFLCRGLIFVFFLRYVAFPNLTWSSTDISISTGGEIIIHYKLL